MTKKTISMHYGTVFSLGHNNREFIPKNVDPERTKWNYNCVVAGQDAYLDFEDPRYVQEFWERYRELNDLYWSNRALADALEYERYRENMRYLWKCRHMLNFYPNNEVEAFFYLLFLPLIICGETILAIKEIQTELEHFEFVCERKFQIQDFRETKFTAREILGMYDQTLCSAYLQTMDAIVKDAARLAENHMVASTQMTFEPQKQERFATLDEIYGKLFEPSFRTFQEKQRACRRYNGTYLEYIREGQMEMALKKKQNKRNKNRKLSEAIEIVIGIGDMDNTGYVAAFQDAKKSEAILKDYCDYLMHQENICFVTTKELEDSDWKPPFKHGLIVLNLTVHCDEATPGIHLTCIPYSRDCKRGPAVQASLGRTMTGMGYPSTWKDVLDEKGQRIPKRNKNNEIICNKDGTIRYLQEPEHQGIIDWIEDQKQWIQNEMERRYGWEREYKGSHARGNLSTPDYQAARAKERYEEFSKAAQELVRDYQKKIINETEPLYDAAKNMLENAPERDILLRYLSHCSDERYEELIEEAYRFYLHLPKNTGEAELQSLAERIKTVDKYLKRKDNQYSPTDKKGRNNR